MWFKNAIRKFIKYINTDLVGRGSFITAEYVEKEDRIYIFPNRDENDLAKEVMWRAYQYLNSPYLPALRKEILLGNDGKEVEIFSSPR